MHCLSPDLQILITSLVSSNLSYVRCVIVDNTIIVIKCWHFLWISLEPTNLNICDRSDYIIWNIRILCTFSFLLSCDIMVWNINPYIDKDYNAICFSKFTSFLLFRFTLELFVILVIKKIPNCTIIRRNMISVFHNFSRLCIMATTHFIYLTVLTEAITVQWLINGTWYIYKILTRSIVYYDVKYRVKYNKSFNR